MDKKAAIRELQFYLRALSYVYTTIPLVGIDGVFGAETTAAVLEFQKLFEITPTGVVDFETWTKIYEQYRIITPINIC